LPTPGRFADDEARPEFGAVDSRGVAIIDERAIGIDVAIIAHFDKAPIAEWKGGSIQGQPIHPPKTRAASRTRKRERGKAVMIHASKKDDETILFKTKESVDNQIVPPESGFPFSGDFSYLAGLFFFA